MTASDIVFRPGRRLGYEVYAGPPDHVDRELGRPGRYVGRVREQDGVWRAWNRAHERTGFRTRRAAAEWLRDQ